MDLDFIKDENGIISMNQTSTKREIESSKYYQGRLDRIAVENSCFMKILVILNSGLRQN